MNSRTSAIRFKARFKNLNFYSMPQSILFVVKKRLNLVFLFLFLVGSLLVTLF